MENLDRLVNELCKLPDEIQWVEFKHNNYNPEMIGPVQIWIAAPQSPLFSAENGGFLFAFSTFLCS